jgi:hypothetical protein
MKMQTCRLISKGVFDIDDNLVAFSSYDGRNWPLVVDAHNRPGLLTIGICVGPAYVEVICDSCALSD